MMTRRLLWIALAWCIAAAPVLPVAAIEPGQLDDFEDGTAMGWTRGAPSPVQPVNVADGGPAGTGDAYLENSSTGGGGPGSNWVMFNNLQWTGSYTAAGVTQLSVELVNFGSVALPVRIAVEGPLGTRWSSSGAFTLPGDGAWHHAVFDLTPAAMSLVAGPESLEEVLAGVTELRFLVAAAPAWSAASVVATIGLDNLAAGDLVFADRFENGTPAGWSTVVP